MMKTNNYKAKTHYQQFDVAHNYEHDRITSWHGKLAHKNELLILKHAIQNYFKIGGTVLDVPCGTGRLFSVYLDGVFEVTGLDVSDSMLSLAKHKYMGNPNFSFIKSDAETLPFSDNSFDYLVSQRFMCHLPNSIRWKVLKEMIRVTKKILAVNFYFDVHSPLMIFNRVFRKNVIPAYPILESDLKKEIQKIDVRLCEIRKLSWYERNSALIILQKK